MFVEVNEEDLLLICSDIHRAQQYCFSLLQIRPHQVLSELLEKIYLHK